MFPAIKTRKFYAMGKGSFGLPNGNTSASIMFAPWRLANNNSINDISPPVLYSTATTASVNNRFLTVDTGAAWTLGQSSLNTDYTAASLVTVGTVGIRYRVVGAGLRVTYVGPPIQASGVYACVEQPDHTTLSGLTLDTVGQYDSFFTMNVTSQETKSDPWVYLTYTPVDVNDFDFESDTVSNALGGTVTNKNHFMGIMVVGAPTGSDYFRWEAIVHYEAIGQIVRGKTDTPSDVLGTSLVLNAIKPETQKTLNTNQTVMSAVKEGSSDTTVTSMEKVAKSALKVLAPELSPLVT
jgi:hypothetical protein